MTGTEALEVHALFQCSEEEYSQVLSMVQGMAAGNAPMSTESERIVLAANALRRPCWSDTTEASSGSRSDAADHARAGHVGRRVCATQSGKPPKGTSDLRSHSPGERLPPRRRSLDLPVVDKRCPGRKRIAGELQRSSREAAPIWSCFPSPNGWSEAPAPNQHRRSPAPALHSLASPLLPTIPTACPVSGL